MRDRKISPIRRAKVVANVGGPLAESSATLAVYGDDLDPKEVTALLGVEPTESFRRGYRRGPRSPATQYGAWFLEVRGGDPAGQDAQLEALLSKLPDSEDVWRKLADQYRVQVRFALHMDGWNKGCNRPVQAVST
jgi:hypothetical protein